VTVRSAPGLAVIVLAAVGALSSCWGGRDDRPVRRGDDDRAIVSGVRDSPGPESGSPTPAYALKIPRVHVPRRVKNAAPVYPEAARRQRLQGIVTLEITIERNGRVSKARVLSGAPLLAQAAIETAMRWEYRPPLLGREPVSITMIESVNFRLKE
jgi:TonB family protein